MAGYPPYQFGAQSGNGAQFFPQSQGGVYLINNSLEVANVPIGAAIQRQKSSLKLYVRLLINVV